MTPTQPQRLAYKQIDAARACGVSVRTFRNWKAKGLVRATVVGGMELYPVSELNRLLGGGNEQERSDANGQPHAHQ